MVVFGLINSGFFLKATRASPCRFGKVPAFSWGIRMDGYYARLQDVGGQEANKFFLLGASLNSIETFLAARSGAGLIGLDLVQALAGVDVTPADAGSDRGVRALLYYKDDNGDQHNFAILAPTAAVTTEQTEEGERVTPASGAAICEDHAEVCGFPTPIVFLSGIVIDPLS